MATRTASVPNLCEMPKHPEVIKPEVKVRARRRSDEAVSLFKPHSGDVGVAAARPIAPSTIVPFTRTEAEPKLVGVVSS